MSSADLSPEAQQGPDPAGEIEGEPRVADPQPFRLGGEPPRVMRLSRKALAFGGGVAACTIAGALIYALQPAAVTAPTNVYEPQPGARPEVVAGAPATYDKVPRLGPPLPGDLGRPILAAQQNAVPAPATAAAPDPAMAARAQWRQRQLDEQQAAIASKLFLGGSAASAGEAKASPQTGMPSALPASASGQVTEPQSARRAFLAPDATKVTTSAHRIVSASSPHTLQAGSIIPAALITGIRSDLPGQITAQVTENVYDSATGKILLIPQGARLIGEYDSAVSAGQTRVLLAWDRLLLPGGRSIELDRLPGADAAGMAGLQDRTNYHWGNMVKAALISTMLGAGTQLVAQGDDDLTRALRYGLQDTINQTGRQVVQREIGIPPTLTIRPGSQLRVIVTRDLILDLPQEEGLR